MNRRRDRRTRALPKIILIFGESDNDTKTIRELILALLPDSSVRVEIRRQPQVNIRDARAEAIPSRVERVARVIDAAAVDSEVVAVFAHEDCDAVEPSHVAVSERLEGAFHSRGYAQVWAAAPAWEMEAWLLQWPDSFKRYVPTWAELNVVGKRVGLISNAKEYVRRSLRVGNRAGREYRETDAPRLAEIVRNEGWVRSPKANSHSFDAFVQRVDALTV